MHLAQKFWLLLLCLASLIASEALAERDGPPTFAAHASGGYSVYKSEMVQSNDTSTTMAYGFGVYAGAGRNVGFLLNRESSTFTFALNDAKLALDWQDIHVRYRFGPIYMGLVIAESHWLVSAPPDADGDDLLDQGADPVELLNISSSSYGVNVGGRFPVAKRGEAYMDLTYAAAGVVKETATDPVEALANGDAIPGTRTLGVGPRMEMDLGGSIEITRWLDVICGFKYRAYSVTIDGKTYKELMNTTYVGLNAGWTF